MAPSAVVDETPNGAGAVEDPKAKVNGVNGVNGHADAEVKATTEASKDETKSEEKPAESSDSAEEAKEAEVREFQFP